MEKKNRDQMESNSKPFRNFSEIRKMFLVQMVKKRLFVWCVCVSFSSHATQATECAIGLSFEFIIKQHVENVAKKSRK